MTKYTKRKTRNGYTVRRKRTWRIQELCVPKDEFEWANTWYKIAKVWSWHHYHGLEHQEPHPMGKDLKDLERIKNQYHVDRYKKSGIEPPGCYLTEGVLR